MSGTHKATGQPRGPGPTTRADHSGRHTGAGANGIKPPDQSTRESVLARIAARLGREASPVASIGTPSTDLPEAVRARLQSNYRHTTPALSGTTLEVLVERMEQALISVVRLQSDAEVAEALRWYTQERGITGSITVAPALSDIDWSCLETADSSAQPRVRTGAASGTEAVGVSACLAAVAETGSIVTASGPGAPAALNYLPDTHVVVLGASQVVRGLDDLWPLIRAADKLPRAVNLLTGPSRTADIEQTLEIGAHGPRRMHVLLVAGR